MVRTVKEVHGLAGPVNKDRGLRTKALRQDGGKKKREEKVHGMLPRHDKQAVARGDNHLRWSRNHSAHSMPPNYKAISTSSEENEMSRSTSYWREFVAKQR